ncbi:hypothetical protein JW960_01640 [candidate division KSB1 bacterium]|nr:hypothetical protein [candidate division KSB1 bacterium]
MNHSIKHIFLALTLILVAFFSSIIHEHDIATRFSYVDSGTPTTIERVEANSIIYTLCFSNVDNQFAQDYPGNANKILSSLFFLQYPQLHNIQRFYISQVQSSDVTLIISFLQRSKPWHHAGDDDPAVC